METKSVTIGSCTDFTLEATGDDLRFQWQKEGKDIGRNGSRLQCSQTDNTSTLRIQHVNKSDQGHYRCLVKNPVEDTSYEADLTVCELVCTVIGLANTYAACPKWIRTSSTKVNTDTPHATTCHQYFSLFLTVDPPKITRHPESQSVVTGTIIAFTVEATGDDLQFLWQKDEKDIDRNGSRLQCSQTDHTSTLRIQYVKKSDQGHYRCLVKNSVEETSYEADLTVCEFACIVIGLVYRYAGCLKGCSKNFIY